MPSAASANRVAATLAGALVLAACASAPPEPRVTPPPPAPRWAQLAEARAWPLAADAFVSRGHGVGHYLVEVRVTPGALDGYRSLAPGDRLPAGTTIAAFHRAREGAAPGSVFAMRKRPEGDWELTVADADGRIEAQGALRPCIGCHSQGTADFLFGVPHRTE